MLLEWKFQYYIGASVANDIRNFIGLVWLERWLIENDSFCKQVIEESNEKVLISEESYGLVDRYLRKLDQELHKFKMELEADNRGITEILEKHSLELDMPANSTLKENRHPKKHVNPPLNIYFLSPTLQVMVKTINYFLVKTFISCNFTLVALISLVFGKGL